MYNFVVPDSLHIRWLNKILLQSMQQHPEWFHQGIAIDTVYGITSNCIWNGNRSDMDEPFCRPNAFLKDVVIDYMQSGARTYCVLFTNFMLKPEMLYDTYANKLCEGMNKIGCSAMVSTELMWNYLSEHYPDITLCWSTTTDYGICLSEQIEKINILSENAIVVLPYHLNNRWDLLAQLKYPHNIEVLADEKCIDNCPLRRQHETNANLNNLYESRYSECLLFGHGYYNLMSGHSTKTNNINRQTLKRYEDMGINKFKFEGRAGDWNLLFGSYVSYFVRDEHINSFGEVVHKYYDTYLKNEYGDK